MSSREAGLRIGALILVVCSLAANAIDFKWLAGKSKDDSVDPRDIAFSAIALETTEEPVCWANPLNTGAIRALVVAPRFTLGDVKALAEQIQMDVDVVAFWDVDSVGSPEDGGPAGTSAEDTLHALQAGLDRAPDVIVVANIDLTQLPIDDLNRLTETVRGGAGLVLCHHRKTSSPALQSFYQQLEPTPDNVAVTRGLGYQLTPEWSSGVGFVQTGQFGEGRVVELDFPGPRPETHCLIPALTHGMQAEWEHFDAYLALAARAVRWAAGSDPAVKIVQVQPEQLPAPSDTELPAGLETEVEGDALDMIRRQLIRPFNVTLDRPSEKAYTVRTRVRRPGMGSNVIATPSTIEKGQSATQVYLVAGSGQYYLDVWLLDKDEVVDWFTEAVVVDAWPIINNLTLNRTSLLTQDTLGISFTMPPRAIPAVVLLRATDPWKRVVAESFVRVPPNTGLIQGSLDLDDLIGGPLKVEVFAVDRDEEVFSEWDTTYAAYAYRFVPVQVSHRERRLDIVAALDGSAEYNARSAYRVLADAGVSAANTDGSAEAVAFLADAGIDPIARVAQYTPDEIENGAVREPCLTDPDWLAVERERLGATAGYARLAGALQLSLGDGNCLTTGDDPVCQSASGVDAYLGYLRSVYGPGGPRSPEGTSESYDQWIDFRTFMDSIFVEFHADMIERVRQVDNRLSVGFAARDGANAFTGYDWRRLVPALDWLAIPLDPLVVECARSYRESGTRLALLMPAQWAERQPGRDRWYPWYAALHGMGQLWLPRVMATSTNVVSTPLVGPTGTFISQAPHLFAAAQAVSSGPARLLAEAQREPPTIAVYDSRSSFYLDCADRLLDMDISTSQRSFIELIRRLGLQFDFISADDVANNRLANYRILMLPMVRSMSDLELDAVQAFHASGGTLVADVSPGAFDEHGNPRPDMPLDALFGVRHIGAQRAGEAADALVQVELDGVRASGTFSQVLPDAGVEAVDASVGGLAGVTPVWLVHRDTGLAALINHGLPQSGEYAPMLATLLDTILHASGVEPPARIEGPDGARFLGEVFSYTLDGNRFIALLADPDAGEQELRVALPDGVAHVDSLANRSVTRYRNHAVTLSSGQAALYTVLSYDVSDLDIETVPTVEAGERLPFTLTVRARKGEPATHVVHVDLLSLQTDATQRIPHYSHDVICKSGLGEGFIRLALNERPGVYKLVARDVLTGTKAEAVVKVVEH